LLVWFDLHRQSWFDPHILDPHGDASETTLEATVMFLVQQFQTMNVALAYSQGKLFFSHFPHRWIFQTEYLY
jgi:hypothetical protein